MFSLKVDDEIELEPPYENRLEEVYAVVTANYDYLREWSHWLNEDYTLEKARAFCRKNIEEFEGGEEYKFRIVYRGKIAGSIELFNIDERNKSAEIGYWLAKAAQGKGLMTKSVSRLLEYAFGELKLNRIYMKCVPENLKSRRIPERLGFTREGTERESGWLHDKFADHVVYSMLAREWREMDNE